MRKCKKGGKVTAKPSVFRPKGYAEGGLVSSTLKPTNQSTVKAKGAGAATRGTNFKV